MRTLVVLVFAIGFLASAWPVSVYKEPTHEKMSQEAASLSVLSKPDTFFVLGLTGGLNNPKLTFPNSQGRDKTISFLMSDGAHFENAFPRPVNHFFDPLNDKPLSGGFRFPDWALEDKDDVDGQEFSFKNARQYFYDALTATNSSERNRNFGLTFETLGRVIHHVQDMAQPQHVRNDDHCDILPCRLVPGLFNPSRYEKYSDEQREKNALRFDGYSVNDRFSANFLTTARSFWHTKEKNPVVGQGIAEFTNVNFLSAGTNFLGAFQNGQLIARPNWRYSLPEPSPVTPRFEDAGALLQSIGKTPPAECAPPNNPCVMAFFAAEVKDNYRGTRTVNPKASTASIFDQDLQFHGIRVPYPNLDKCANPADTSTCETIETNQIFSLNRFNFDEAHKFLIPRAVAYSAGLIDYFFRGRLEAEDVEFTDTGVRLRVKSGVERSNA